MMRVGVIGGGISGTTISWLLDGQHEVVLFEAEDQLGGHAHSIQLTDDLAVDLGAQYVSPVGFPTYGRLLVALGLADHLASAPVTLTVQTGPDRMPVLVSPHEPDRRRRPITGPAWTAMVAFLTAAAEFQAQNPSWEVPLADLMEPMDVPRWAKDDLLYPLLAQVMCCGNDDAPGVSARAAIEFYLGIQPEAEGHAPMWANLTVGTQAVANRIASGLQTTTVRTAIAVEHVRRIATELEIVDNRGDTTVVDAVVLAVPAHAAVPLLTTLASTQPLRNWLAKFRYSRAVIGIHRDPIYMPDDLAHWSTVNVEVHDGWAEACNWYGPVHDVDVFKSWLTYRAKPPTELIAMRDFRHLIVTPEAVRARTALAQQQGEGGIYHVGTHMHSIDSQESAVASAVAVARKLAPENPRLSKL
jgi:uncharacterized protein